MSVVIDKKTVKRETTLTQKEWYSIALTIKTFQQYLKNY